MSFRFRFRPMSSNPAKARNAATTVHGADEEVRAGRHAMNIFRHAGAMARDGPLQLIALQQTAAGLVRRRRLYAVMTSMSTGPRVDSSFSPSCSLSVVITDEPSAWGRFAI